MRTSAPTPAGRVFQRDAEGKEPLGSATIGFLIVGLEKNIVHGDAEELGELAGVPDANGFGVLFHAAIRLAGNAEVVGNVLLTVPGILSGLFEFQNCTSFSS